MIKPLVQRLARSIRPRGSEALDIVPLRTLGLWIRYKAAGPIIRGTLLRYRLGGVDGLFFLGKGVRIMFPKRLNVGSACVIGDYTWMLCHSEQGVFLGSRVTIREFGWIQTASHPARPGQVLRIGDDTYIGPRCSIGVGGSVIIGARNRIGGSFCIVSENHQPSAGDALYEMESVSRLGITIGDDCWIGNNVTVLDGVHIADRVTIGAGAVVTRDVPSGCVVVGVPARPVNQGMGRAEPGRDGAS